jgi:hypothetical protein
MSKSVKIRMNFCEVGLRSANYTNPLSRIQLRLAIDQIDFPGGRSLARNCRLECRCSTEHHRDLRAVLRANRTCLRSAGLAYEGGCLECSRTDSPNDKDNHQDKCRLSELAVILFVPIAKPGPCNAVVQKLCCICLATVGTPRFRVGCWNCGSYREGIRIGNVALVGYSEGGLIAPMVAADDPKIAAIVTLDGSGTSGMDLARYQSSQFVLRDVSIPAPQRAEAIKKRLADDLKDLTPRESVVLTIDPIPYARRIRCPALILHGGLMWIGDLPIECGPTTSWNDAAFI